MSSRYKRKIVRISNDKNSEYLKKTLEILIDFYEKGPTITVASGLAKVYCDYLVSERCLTASSATTLPTVKQLASVLRSCLLSHRFTDAACILDLLSFDIRSKTSPYLFQGGLEVLENHPDATPELMEYFARNILVLSHLNKKEVLLEYMMYHLKNKQPEQLRAVQQLLRARVAMRHNSVINSLYQAYSVLPDYISWAKLKQLDKHQDAEMEKLKERIISIWPNLLQSEGQWDIFVPKLIEVMDFYGKINEAEAILEKHLSTNDKNLNSYIFLYEYLKKHGRNHNRQVECLKTIARISPSDSLVLELIPFLFQENKREKAVRLLLKFVDYADNKNNLTCWKMLANICISVLENPCNRTTNALQSGWKKSCSYWPIYHFDPNNITVKNKDDAKLLIHKSTFLFVIQGTNKNPYARAAEKSLADYPNYVNKLRKVFMKVQSLTSYLMQIEDMESD